ncbi:uncharacterized protein Tco025E_06152 [Trypanosoma conorhini]|uniref:Uncharacterized protein n=1 Tax=Trypanosoma conorhini TaxID=83891 RepID=A0A3R7ME73_9TRYP|nr:uncharacterized protein Tco025E_06152 [Trypanosoma conorhini]RNF13604.1 hypothetical protein Tco025E_06152 [Trypanosoma conorhini]
MLSRCRPNFRRPFMGLSFTVSECISGNKMEPWATLSMTRRSSRDPWELGVHQRKTSVYLNPLPDEAVAGSVVAKQFLASSAFPYVNAIRVVSVNGVPAASASKVRHELSRCNTAVLHLTLHASRYRLAEKKRRESLAADAYSASLEAAEAETPIHGSNVQKKVAPAVVTDARRRRTVPALAKEVAAGNPSPAQGARAASTPTPSPRQATRARPRGSKKRMPGKVREAPSNTRVSPTAAAVHAEMAPKRVTPEAIDPAKVATVSL